MEQRLIIVMKLIKCKISIFQKNLIIFFYLQIKRISFDQNFKGDFELINNLIKKIKKIILSILVAKF